MRVWQDGVRRCGDVMHVWIAFADDRVASSDLGHQERVRHIELVKNGARCYLIMCQADDIRATPRRVKDFDHENVFLGGKVIETESDFWIELLHRVPIQEVALPSG